MLWTVLVSDESTPVPVEYSPWELDPASGMLFSIVRRTDTGEIIGRAERSPNNEEESN
jgi:hypothetical protein